MNTIRNLVIGAVAFAGFAVATPAQAHDHHYYHHSYGHHYYHGGYYGGYYGGPVVTYGGGPYYSGYYDSYPAYGYGYAPGISFAFGGHRGYYHHSYYHHHR